MTESKWANRVHPADVTPTRINYANRLKEPFKTEWITALRSGRYKQTTHYLETIKWSEGVKEIANCCFGVACRILPDVAAFEGTGLTSFDYHGFQNLKFMPSLLATNLGFADRTGRFSYEVSTKGATYHDCPYEESSLVTMNDRGFTFDQIADVIEYFF